MEFLGGQSFNLAKFLLLKGTALTSLIAFTVIYRQYTGLVGEDGVLPIREFTKEKKLRETVSLFHFFNSDRFMNFSAAAGILFSLLALSGIPSTFSSVLSSINWFLIWLLLISFFNTGQKFYENNWGNILLESVFLSIFMAGAPSQMHEVLVLIFRWLLFRMMLGSGLIKIHGDEKWMNLTALRSHFETQPFPGPLSWYLDKLPDSILDTGVLATHAILLVVPFFYFAPQPYAAFAGVLTIIFQVLIFAAGNYGWLNLITAVLAFSTFNDALIASVLPFAAEASASAAYPYGDLPVLLAGFIGVLSIGPIKNMLSREQVQNRSFTPLRLVNSYGAFRKVPKERKEIVLEASKSRNPKKDDWSKYRFYSKPGDPSRRPQQVAPYFHRLEYPIWFTARYRDTEWLEELMEKLKQGSDEVEDQFREVPVSEPEKIRARIYRYRFTSPGEREETGDWWCREPLETLLEK